MSHKKVCKNEDFCEIVRPSQKGNLLQSAGNNLVI